MWHLDHEVSRPFVPKGWSDEKAWSHLMTGNAKTSILEKSDDPSIFESDTLIAFSRILQEAEDAGRREAFRIKQERDADTERLNRPTGDWS